MAFLFTPTEPNNRSAFDVVMHSNPGDFPRTSSKTIDQSASRSLQNFGGTFYVRNVLTTSITSFGELIFVKTRLILPEKCIVYLLLWTSFNLLVALKRSGDMWNNYRYCQPSESCSFCCN